MKKKFFNKILSNGLIIELDIEHFNTINEIETILDFMQINNLKNFI